MQHILSVSNWSRSDLDWILRRAHAWKSGDEMAVLRPGPRSALILERPSFRTRIAYEGAMHCLRGSLTVFEGGVGTSDSIEDVARVVSGMLDIVFVRTRDHHSLQSMAEHADIPIVNALSDREHPVEVLADALILRERYGDLGGMKIAFLGASGNVCTSVLLLAPLLGMDVVLACPPDYAPESSVLERVAALAAEYGTHVEITSDADAAAREANAVYTDGWPAIEDADERERIFGPYRVTGTTMSLAAPDAVFLHCLPAKRECEVTSDVLESGQSLAFQRVTNLVPTTAAAIEWALGASVT